MGNSSCTKVTEKRGKLQLRVVKLTIQEVKYSKKEVKDNVLGQTFRLLRY